MERSITKRIFLNTFWLSVLLHLFLLFCLTIVFFFNTSPPEEKKKPPNLFVPSYVYRGAISPSQSQPQPTSQQQAQSKAEQQQQQTEEQQESAPDEMKSAVEEEKATIVRSTRHEKNMATEKHRSTQKSIMAATREVLKQNQRNTVSVSKETDPIYLIGDENQVADPLIKLLGRALSAHFEYPRVAGELGITGRVIVGLTLHPEGYISDVEILRSSDNQDLDAAALYAINTAPTIVGVERFIQKPKHFVIGFIFR